MQLCACVLAKGLGGPPKGLGPDQGPVQPILCYVQRSAVTYATWLCVCCCVCQRGCCSHDGRSLKGAPREETYGGISTDTLYDWVSEVYSRDA